MAMTECPNCGSPYNDLIGCEAKCTTFQVGEIVHDDLTRQICKIIEIFPPDPNSMTGGIKVDHE